MHHVTPVIAIDSNGMRFFVSTTDATGSWFFAMRESFDETHFATALTLAERFYPHARSRPRTLIDVGANIGTTSIAAVARYGFDRAIALEPEPSNLYFLRQNVLANHLEDKIRIVPLAVTDCDGEVELELSPDNSGDHRVRVGAPERGLFHEDRRTTKLIEAKTLDNVLAAEAVSPDDIGLVWVDVQGFEAHVLAGATTVLGASVPVVIEYWPYGLRRNGSLERLWGLLADHYSGFLDVRSATPDDEPQPIEKVQDVQVGAPDGFTDLLLVR